MTNTRYRAFIALAVAGVLWGTTMPMTKVALDTLSPSWLAVSRFVIAGIGLALISRERLSDVATPAVLGWGAFGYGGSIVLQNVGVAHTSANHASLIVGAAPVLVAVFATAWHRTQLGAMAWIGAAVSVVGVGLVAQSRAGDASLAGDAIVFASLLFICLFTVAQPGLLKGRDPIAVTAVQLLAAAAATIPVAAITDGPMVVGSGLQGIGIVLALAVLGTMAPFALFAYGQVTVRPEIAGAFVNIEPLVGVLIGAAFLGESLGLVQVVGGLGILAGLALGSRNSGASADAPEPVPDLVVPDDLSGLGSVLADVKVIDFRRTPVSLMRAA